MLYVMYTHTLYDVAYYLHKCRACQRLFFLRSLLNLLNYHYYRASEASPEFNEEKACLYHIISKFNTNVPNALDNPKREFTIATFTRTITIFVQTLGLVHSPPMFYIFLVMCTIVVGG